jgi:hypothetical protein
MNVQAVPVLEPVHEKADPRPGRAYHLPERLLTDLGNYSLGNTFLTKMSKQEQNPSQSLFAGIEKLVDQIFFVSTETSCFSY